MKPLIFILLTACMMLGACRKKSSDIAFNGRVINPGNNTPIEGAAVSIASTSVQSWVYNSNFQDIANTSSATDGTFSFEFPSQAASAYRIYIFKSNYFPNTTLLNANDVTPDAPYNADFELIPEATINLHIRNTSPTDSADRILYRILLQTVSCVGCCPTGYIEGEGPTYDTTIVCKTYGNMYFIVESNITKGISTVIRKDSVYMEPFVESDLDIFY
jgi:hypothetical protein